MLPRSSQTGISNGGTNDLHTRWDAAEVKIAANGRWTVILPAVTGIDAAVLDERKHPCPKCGGTDRFRRLDAETGALFCNQCFNAKNGDGFAAIQWLMGWTFPETLQAVAESLNLPCSRNGHAINGKPRGSAAKPTAKLATNGKAKPDATAKGNPFPTKEAAVAALCRMMTPTHGPPAGQWTYHAAAGEPVALVLRFNGADGSKEFRPVSLHDGSWFLKGPATPRPLYGLPDLTTAATSSDCEVSRCDRDNIGTRNATTAATVYVCEGEKTADAARSLGLVAVTSMNGALSPDKTDWTPLAGKNVVILPDHDEPGRKYAEAVAAILAKLSPAPVVKIVELPGLSEGDDLVEWIAAHGDAAEPDAMRQELERLVDAVDVARIVPTTNGKSRTIGHTTTEAIVVRLSEVEEQAVEWLWPNRIPLGKLTLLADDPGLGKSFVTVDMAARVSTGRGWPDCYEQGQPVGSVILFNCEDDLADTVLPRLNKAGGDPSLVIALQGVACIDAETGQRRQRGFSLDNDLPTLQEVLEANRDVRLVVIDPVSAYCGATDSHKNADIRAMLAPLAELAGRYRAAVVMVTHLAKGSGGKAVYRAMGSLAFAAAARAVWHVGKDHEDDKRRLILMAKINVCEEATGLAYRLKDGEVCWEEMPVAMTADEYLASERAASDESAEQRGDLQEAIDYLLDTLRDGPRATKDVEADAKSHGIKVSTLRRARKKLKVKPEKSGMEGVWQLRLSDGLHTPAEDAQP